MIATLFKARVARPLLGYFDTRAFYHGDNNHILTIFKTSLTIIEWCQKVKPARTFSYF